MGVLVHGNDSSHRMPTYPDSSIITEMGKPKLDIPLRIFFFSLKSNTAMGDITGLGQQLIHGTLWASNKALSLTLDGTDSKELNGRTTAKPLKDDSFALFREPPICSGIWGVHEKFLGNS